MEQTKYQQIHLKEYGIYLAAYLAAIACSKQEWYAASGVVLGLAALFLYIRFAKESGSLVDLKALFSLSWIGGEGIACLKLSRLSAPWEIETWLSFYLAYLLFCAGYDWMQNCLKKRTRKSVLVKTGEAEGTESLQARGNERRMNLIEKNSMDSTAAGKQKIPTQKRAKRVLICIVCLMAGSVLCFGLEAWILGYIPILSSAPHAYSYFHVSGVHYFTISCILIPGLTLVYLKLAQKTTTLEKGLLLLGNATAVGIPIFCVSRFQLLFSVGFAAVIYVLLYKKITWKMVVVGLVVMIPLYVMLTFFRHHDVAYLNGIFEMKNASMPIFVSQPYIYIANNYDNFNFLVGALPGHSFGLKGLFPLWALSGLKFFFPQLINFPIYVDKTELTTLTLFYDSYYDFGWIGVLLFSCVLGAIAYILVVKLREMRNPLGYLLYAQFAAYLMLSFFTTWFSNTTTWFYLILTGIMALFYHLRASRW